MAVIGLFAVALAAVVVAFLFGCRFGEHRYAHRDARGFWGVDRDWQPGDLRGGPYRPRVVERGPPRHALVGTDTDEFHALIGREFPRLPVEVT